MGSGGCEGSVKKKMRERNRWRCSRSSVMMPEVAVPEGTSLSVWGRELRLRGVRCVKVKKRRMRVRRKWRY